MTAPRYSDGSLIFPNRELPETERCSKCGDNTAFEWTEGEGWLSVCCARPPKALPADAS